MAAAAWLRPRDDHLVVAAKRRQRIRQRAHSPASVDYARWQGVDLFRQRVPRRLGRDGYTRLVPRRCKGQGRRELRSLRDQQELLRLLDRRRPFHLEIEQRQRLNFV